MHGAANQPASQIRGQFGLIEGQLDRFAHALSLGPRRSELPARWAALLRRPAFPAPRNAERPPPRAMRDDGR
ncbi:hypothetical protein GCM10009786_09850 [Leucobacter alluvii]|uniref:Uncharacterized protein n=1 Tax=Leucobacter alluvii TaxID=340321 RepID=A0ABN3B413_9MICO